MDHDCYIHMRVGGSVTSHSYTYVYSTHTIYSTINDNGWWGGGGGGKSVTVSE